MSLRNMSMVAVAVAAMLGSAAAGHAAELADGGVVVTQGNLLDVQQYKVENARIPGTSIRQNMTVWQVREGMWNGQELSGLTLVVMEQASADGTGGRTFAAYVTHYASPEQRSALVAAISAAQPTMGALKDPSSLRVEPAVIRVDLDGATVVIHLGLIS